jgi:hypothetical protein
MMRVIRETRRVTKFDIYVFITDINKISLSYNNSVSVSEYIFPVHLRNLIHVCFHHSSTTIHSLHPEKVDVVVWAEAKKHQNIFIVLNCDKFNPSVV